jgi:PKD repeat protein
MKRSLFLAILLFWLIFVPIGSGSGSSGNWTLVHADAAFSPRAWQGTAVFEDRLWIIGGSLENGTTMNDVWSYGPDYEVPEGSFRGNVSGGLTPFMVAFSDSSAGENRMAWDFGDGGKRHLKKSGSFVQ